MYKFHAQHSMANEQLINRQNDLIKNDFESGVSNGDVDWLFRGKSKKLTKKMNQNKELDDQIKDANKQGLNCLSRKGSIIQTQDSELNIKKPGDGSDQSRVEVPEPNKEESIEALEETGRPEFKLDKAFRQRSTSNSPSPSTAIPKKKFNALDYSGSSFDGGSYMSDSYKSDSALGPNQSSSVSSGRVSINSKSNAISIEPKGRSRSSSMGSSASSNNSFLKKSLFSSISSKFKSNDVQNPSQSSSPKTPNFLGSGGSFTSDFDGFSSFFIKGGSDANGIAVGSKRTDQSRKNSVDMRRNSVELRKNSVDTPSSPSFNSLFKRRTSTSSQSSVSSSKPQIQPQPTIEEQQRIILNKNPNKSRNTLEELNDISLKRVVFAIDKMDYDPQQQIPSRQPRKGNVLIPEDLTAPPPRLAQGISLTDGAIANDTPRYSEKELALAIEAQKRALIEADKHSQEAHLAAKRLSYEVDQINAKVSRQSKLEDTNKAITEDIELDDEVTDLASNVVNEKQIEIDKPLHVHENHFDVEQYVNIDALTLEQIYTRCCHLREILPIPATLKQLKNKTKPLQVLKLLNPKPTLIDVLSFSDFIAIVPITTIIFDNVTMTTEMLKHILASLVNNKYLEKLSLRNVPIDELGWKYLCKFLSGNSSIKKLDISQQRIKADLKSNQIRSSMNWPLFIKCLINRGGIEELVINGCKLNDDTFNRLIETLTSTMRLGIASCELNHNKSRIVCEWLKKPTTKCIGVDIAFNDLSRGQLSFFIEAFNSGNVKLIFFSLYQTNLSDIGEFTELLKALTKVKPLRFLDLSSLPALYPGVISKLNTYLPNFSNLKRIHFDLNDLTSQSIIAILEILPKVKGLYHVSFLGNRNLNNSVAASIYGAIKTSSSIFTMDLDYDLINDQLNQRIAFYLMRNMENVVEPNAHNKHNDDQEELMFDGSLLMEAAEKLLNENDNKPNKVEDFKLQKIISNALIERTRELRQSIHRTIDSLFEKRNNGTLTLEGKESLLRFCLLDSSLEQLVNLFEEQAKISSSPISPSPSIEDAKVRDDDKSLHHKSTEVITTGPILLPRNTETLTKLGYDNNADQSNFQPHQVVVDSSKDGKNIPIDYLTGRPVLMRSISQTSTHAKEQELEEGEFHRWGYFINQRRNNTPQKEEDDTQKLPKLSILPSGNELRDAIIEAKGIESITELINKINNNRFNIEKLYDVSDPHRKQQVLDTLEKMKIEEDKQPEVPEVDSDNNQVEAVVDEVYDKLLNDAQRVRSETIDKGHRE